MQTYAIAVQDFTTLSRYIAAFTPSISISEKVLQTLDRAIAVRKAHGAWYAKFAKECEQHTYFVNVLEDVKKTLQPLVRPNHDAFRTKTKPILSPNLSGGHTRANSGSLNSRFELLEVEDVSDEDDILPTPNGAVSVQTGSNAPHVQVVVSAEEELAEAYFAVWCFFEDLNKLRAFTHQTWMDYRDGNLNLVPASINTNTAVDLVRSLEEDLHKIYPRECNEIVRLYYQGCCKAAGEDPQYKERPSDCFNFAAYEAAERSFLTTETNLLTCLRELIGNHIFPPLREYSTMTPREKFLKDKDLLLEHFYNMKATKKYGVVAPSEDEFTKLSRRFAQDGKMSICLLFAASAYLTSYHVLQEGIWYVLRDFYAVGRSISHSLNEHIDFHKGLKVNKWHAKNDENLKDLLRIEIDNWTSSAQEATERFLAVSYVLNIVITLTHSFRPPNSKMHLVTKRYVHRTRGSKELFT
jgi:hypothetical protein